MDAEEFRRRGHELVEWIARCDTLAIAQRINDSGAAYLTTSSAHGEPILRVSIGAERTERHHVAALWELLRAPAPAQ